MEREKIRLLKKYMDDKGLKKETQERIMKYVRFYLSKENISRIKDSDMMQYLSDNLKDDIIKEVNVKLLSDCYVFSYNFGRQFLLAISKELIERFYGPGEFIYQVELSWEKKIEIIKFYSFKIKVYIQRILF